MEFTLKKYACSLCKKEDTKRLLTKQHFFIVKCRQCGFVYVNPRVENRQLAGIYQHFYFKIKIMVMWVMNRKKDYGLKILNVG